MARKRSLLLSVLAVTVSTRRFALGLSRNSIRTHVPESPISVSGQTVQTVDETVQNIADKECIGTTSGVQSRKQALRSMSTVVLAGLVSSSIAPSRSNAYDASFPVELTDVDKNDEKNTGVLIGKRSNAQQRKLQAEESKKILDKNLATFSVKKDLLPSATWGLALFFGSGSRSNPLVRPLANIIYDEKEEKWLQERNLGLFSSLPIEFLLLQGVIFFILGGLTEYTLLQLSDGDSGVCAQLAGVALINGGFFEIGRIASYVLQCDGDDCSETIIL